MTAKAKAFTIVKAQFLGASRPFVTNEKTYRLALIHISDEDEPREIFIAHDATTPVVGTTVYVRITPSTDKSKSFYDLYM
jgi:hypothetical protein